MGSDEVATEVPQEVVAYLGDNQTMTLATASSAGVPHASTFLYVNDGPKLFFWTKPSTTTARHIEQNPMVSFAVDQYAEDLSQTKGVQGAGECQVLLNGEEIARVADLFGQKFPNLAPGATMSISFFRVTPTDLQFIDNSQSGGAAPEGVFGADFHKERSYSVFSELPALSGGATVAADLQRVEAQAGEVIAREGGPADKFFVVVEGEVEIARDQDGQPGAVDKHGAGALVGDVAIMRDTPRTATVTATKPSVLLALDRDGFRALVAESLGTTEDFVRIIQDRLGA
jgi:uncharacterized protein YhbP (UPF0306 family)